MRSQDSDQIAAALGCCRIVLLGGSRPSQPLRVLHARSSRAASLSAIVLVTGLGRLPTMARRHLLPVQRRDDDRCCRTSRLMKGKNGFGGLMFSRDVVGFFVVDAGNWLYAGNGILFKEQLQHLLGLGEWRIHVFKRVLLRFNERLKALTAAEGPETVTMASGSSAIDSATMASHVDLDLSFRSEPQ